MKKLLLVSLISLSLVACKSTNPDPDNGVSNASYRLAITKAESNVAAVASKMLVLKAADHVHSSDWWDAQIDLMLDTRNLLHDTLLGSTK